MSHRSLKRPYRRWTLQRRAIQILARAFLLLALYAVVSHAAKPTASNTGWQPTGVTLAASGSISVTTNGTVVDSKDISGTITIQASNVTVKRCRVRTSSFYPIRVVSGSNITIEDTEVDGMGGSSKAIYIENGHVLIQRLNIHDSEDGLSLGGTAGITLKDSYIHNPRHAASGHSDGFELYGGGNMTIQNNNLDYAGANTSAANFSDFYSKITNITMDGNWLAGGAYVMYLDGNFTAGGMDNIKVTNNRWARNSAQYGDLVARGDLTNVCWNGNVYDDNGQALTYGGPGQVTCTTTPPPPSGSVCDLSQDGSTTVADVQLCSNQAIGAAACTTGDINQDGRCTVVDVQRVVNAALGGPCVSP